jgi:TetR/AcrR family transcriptional regulator, acrAB operon repressor
MAMAATRKQEMGAETRRRLLDAAFDLAAEGGASAMSIQAVADRSGISRGSVAWHFGSKDGLLVAVIDEAFRWGEDCLRQHLDAVTRPTVEALIEANFSLMLEDRARIFATILLEALTGDDVIRSTYAAHYVELRRFYADYLRSVAPHLADPAATATALLGSTLGVNIQYLLDPDTVDRRAAVTALELVYARGVEQRKPRRTT